MASTLLLNHTMQRHMVPKCFNKSSLPLNVGYHVLFLGLFNWPLLFVVFLVFWQCCLTVMFFYILLTRLNDLRLN